MNAAFACHVCGSGPDGVVLHRQNCTGKPGIWACAAHFDRIKCAIDGCNRTRAGKPITEWICSVHWRRYCPPRSARRRAYLSFFRKAKREGWSDDLSARYWRFWDQLVASAQARHAGRAIDVTAINKMFGWTDE